MLKLKDIQDSYNQRKAQRESHYKTILEQAHRKIQKTVSLNHDMFMFYEVPFFQFGCPLYNLEECIGFIQKSLVDGGFVVKYYFPNIIYVSWNPQELAEMRGNVVKAILNDQQQTSETKLTNDTNLLINESKPLKRATGSVKRRLTLDMT